MILNLVYTSKDLNTSHQIRFKLIYLLLDLGIISLYIEDIYYLFNVLTSVKSIIKFIVFNKVDIETKEKYLLCLASFLL